MRGDSSLTSRAHDKEIPESNSGLTDKGDNRPYMVDTIYCSDQDYEAVCK